MIDRCDPVIATWSEAGDNFVVKNVEKFASVSSMQHLYAPPISAYLPTYLPSSLYFLTYYRTLYCLVWLDIL